MAATVQVGAPARRQWIRDIGRARVSLTILAASAIYGLSAGSIDGLQGAVRSSIKFPLLIFLCGGLCALAWWILARFLAAGMSLRSSTSLAMRAFADASVMLASLAPVNLFLSLVFDKANNWSLGEYPIFLGLNVLFIAVCGTVAVVRQAFAVRKQYSLTARRANAVVAAWLAVCLFTGGQCAWYLRPFYGVSTIKDVPFILGTKPDFRGATSFYEAVYHLLDSPPLPRDYTRWHGTVR